ncbi:hypothetical protein LX36DRAFT_344298 [Colletotrichum falcatum]|nr:hypothetical protein LX36DRAFT_344298 [Colletotrichum falcatum]
MSMPVLYIYACVCVCVCVCKHVHLVSMIFRLQTNHVHRCAHIGMSGAPERQASIVLSRLCVMDAIFLCVFYYLPTTHISVLHPLSLS